MPKRNNQDIKVSNKTKGKTNGSNKQAKQSKQSKSSKSTKNSSKKPSVTRVTKGSTKSRNNAKKNTISTPKTESLSIIDAFFELVSTIVYSISFVIVAATVYSLFWQNLPHSSQIPSNTELYNSENIAQTLKIYDFIGDVSNITWKSIDGANNRQKLTNIAKERTPIKILRSPAKRWRANIFWPFLDYNPSILLTSGQQSKSSSTNTLKLPQTIPTDLKSLQSFLQTIFEFILNYITSFTPQHDPVHGTPTKNSANYINHIARLHYESRFRSQIEDWSKEIIANNENNNNIDGVFTYVSADSKDSKDSSDDNEQSSDAVQEKEINWDKVARILERDYYNYSDDIISLYRLKNGSNFYIFEQNRKPLTNLFFPRQSMRLNHGQDDDDIMSQIREDSEFSFDTNLAIDVVNASLVDYLNYLNNPTGFKKRIGDGEGDDDFYYYLSDVTHFDNDMKPNDWLHIAPGEVKFSKDYKTELGMKWSTQLEMAPFGMITAMQHQISHQFFYQVEGARQFIIAEPSAHEKLHPYPEGHPRHQSSQIPPSFYNIPFRSWKSRIGIPFDPTELHNDLGIDNIKSHIVTLLPGEMLYIPPFYWYSIISLDSSITVNSWTLGLEEIYIRLSSPQTFPSFMKESYHQIMNELDLQNANEERKQEAQRQRLHMLAYFVRFLVDRVIKTLPDQRDIPVTIDQNTRLSEYDNKMNWDVDHYWIEKNLINIRYKTNYIWNKLECNNFDPTRCPKSGNTTETILEDISKHGKTWALAYKQMKFFINNKNDLYNIRNIMLSNHIEQIISYVAGYGSNLCLFLQCIINDRFGALYIESKEEELERELKQEEQKYKDNQDINKQMKNSPLKPKSQ